MKTNWYADNLLRQAFRGTPLAWPAQWYLAASSEPFNPALTGSTIVEVAERVAVARNSTQWGAPAVVDGVLLMSNSTRILFAAASGAWPPVLSLYLCDALTGGNAWFGDDLAGPIVVPDGQTLALPVGAAVFTER